MHVIEANACHCVILNKVPSIYFSLPQIPGNHHVDANIAIIERRIVKSNVEYVLVLINGFGALQHYIEFIHNHN